jgi:ribosomal protein L7/L12
MDLSLVIHSPWLVLAIAALVVLAVHLLINRAFAGPRPEATPSAWSIRTLSEAPSAGPREGYTVVLAAHGDAPINVLKALREVTGADLKGAKELLDGVPSIVVSTPNRAEAEHVAERLRQQGASVLLESAETPGERFEVRLEATGDQPIHTIRLVREVSGRGLKESKDLVDAGPGVVTVCRSRAEAERIRRQLEEGGASVTYA